MVYDWLNCILSCHVSIFFVYAIKHESLHSALNYNSFKLHSCIVALVSSYQTVCVPGNSFRLNAGSESNLIESNVITFFVSRRIIKKIKCSRHIYIAGIVGYKIVSV